MSTREEPANLGKVLSFLREWDRGDRTVRGRMLNTFLSQHKGKSFCELECEFAQVSSLFLARLTTWMRLTYMFGTCLGLQLSAIGIFLSASGHDQYLVEFLEDGGVLTLLDVLSHTQSREEDKADALRLLLTVSNAGRKYKEIICESHGVKVIADCLDRSNTEEAQETVGALLESLSHGNPKYQNQIYKSLITLMACSSPRAQQLVLHTLHIVQSRTKATHHSIVEPLLNMLRSLHLEVQDEAVTLILGLKCYDVRSALLSGLVALLRPINEEAKQHQSAEEAETITIMTGSLPVFVQQAAAAKAIRYGHDAKHFVRSFPVIEEHVQRVMGNTLFAAFMHQAETVYMNLDETQAEILLTNKVNISAADWTSSERHVLNVAGDELNP
ncbi:hypothetical protein F2P81_005697 [Scophthalmus maximus]|uniref:Armadillo-like helical domain containing protein 1 n=1 Tax=Scophthalmus maximus TaxID=52904 RepID=A0A6A4TAB7_SCOMX|nr:hypothetical protein F2P81_005697 [Scophthalmus maximus]